MTETANIQKLEQSNGSRLPPVSGYISERLQTPLSEAKQTFSTIVADPPWRTTTGPPWGYNGTGHEKLAYQTMSLEEIAALPVGELAKKAAHLYLWTTNILVRRAYEIVEAWGFRPSVLLTWCKNPMGPGLGDAFGITTEHILFAHRGGLRPLRREPTTWWNWKRGAHSAKPEAFIDMVETVSPGPYLEMFARRNRLGWATWGNECLNHIGAVAPAAQKYNAELRCGANYEN